MYVQMGDGYTLLINYNHINNLQFIQFIILNSERKIIYSYLQIEILE
jgi:hypothetical protein